MVGRFGLVAFFASPTAAFRRHNPFYCPLSGIGILALRVLFSKGAITKALGVCFCCLELDYVGGLVKRPQRNCHTSNALCSLYIYIYFCVSLARQRLLTEFSSLDRSAQSPTDVLYYAHKWTIDNEH